MTVTEEMSKVPDPAGPGRRQISTRARIDQADQWLGDRIRRRAALPKRAPLEYRRHVLAYSLLVLAGLMIWSVLYLLAFSGLQHARAQHKLYATLRGDLALATAPSSATRPGRGVALLTIPNAGLHDEVIVEGTTSDVLRDGPGHLRTTPLPGQPGVSVVLGRSATFGAPFAHLTRLRVGDPITVVTVQGTFTYYVTDARRPGDRIPQPPASNTGRLTLETSLGGWTPEHVLYVDAALKGTPATDPGGRPTALDRTEKPMAGQTTTLTYFEIMLWLQLLVIVASVLVWLRHRWGVWQVWVVGSPALLAVLWGTSSTASRVLPNLF